jgi:YggT family protein
MLGDIAQYLIDIVAAVLGVTLLLRAYMNWLGMPGRNPLAQFVYALTDWLVQPLRRILPAAGRIDTASLVGALLVALLAWILLFAVRGVAGMWPWGSIILLSITQVLRWSLYLVMWLTIIHVLLSWINPYAPAAPGIAMLVRPFLAPFQRIIPPIGGIDLSPLALLVVVNVLLLVLGRIG